MLKLPVEYDGETAYKVMFHCFGNGWDDWFDTEKEARECIAQQIKEGERDLRIYVDIYWTKEDYDNGDRDESAIGGIYFLGEFPS